MIRSAIVQDALILRADYAWQEASPRRRVLVRLLAWRERFVTHLGDRVTIGWMLGRPYLIAIREGGRGA